MAMDIDRFQFLIGSLESHYIDLEYGKIDYSFQFLIGSLESKYQKPFNHLFNFVSIPYR